MGNSMCVNRMRLNTCIVYLMTLVVVGVLTRGVKKGMCHYQHVTVSCTLTPFQMLFQLIVLRERSFIPFILKRSKYLEENGANYKACLESTPDGRSQRWRRLLQGRRVLPFNVWQHVYYTINRPVSALWIIRWVFGSMPFHFVSWGVSKN